MQDKDEMEFNKLVEKYQWKISVTAKKYYRKSILYHSADRMNSLDDLYQIGLIILYDCWKRYKHLPEEQFRVVFFASLERRICREAKRNRAHHVYDSLTEEEAEKDSHYSRYYVTSLGKDDFEMELLIDEIKSKLSSNLTKAIFMELIDPSPRTLLNAIMDEKRKKMIKTKKKGNYSYHNIGIKYQHVYWSLNITRSQFTYHLNELKKVVNSVLDGGSYA